MQLSVEWHLFYSSGMKIIGAVHSIVVRPVFLKVGGTPPCVCWNESGGVIAASSNIGGR